MSVGIVVELEVVHVDHEHAERPIMPMCAPLLLLEAPLEQAPVEYPGQGIVNRLVLDILIQAGVLESDGDLAGEHLQDPDLRSAKQQGLSAGGVEHSYHTVAVDQREADDRTQSFGADKVTECVVQSWIYTVVLRLEDRPFGRHLSADPSTLLDLQAQESIGDQPMLRDNAKSAFVAGQRGYVGHFGFCKSCRLLNCKLENLVYIQGGRHSSGDPVKRFQLVPLPLPPVNVILPVDGQSELRGHGLEHRLSLIHISEPTR